MDSIFQKKEEKRTFFRKIKNMGKYVRYDDDPDNPIAYGLGALITSFLFSGTGALIYFLRLRDPELSLADKIALWIFAGIAFFIGFSLLIYSLAVLAGMYKDRPTGGFIWINTHPVAGLMGFILSLIFALTVVFFQYPEYLEGKGDEVGMWFFIVGAVLCFIYSVYVLIKNIERMIKKRGS